MRLTLLQIVQKVLTVMDSDKVASIQDTEESEQVVSICEDVYFETVSKHEKWAWLHRLVALDNGTADAPTHINLADTVTEITQIRYDVSEPGEAQSYRELTYLTPEEFLEHVYQRDTKDTTNVMVQSIFDHTGSSPSTVYIPILKTSTPNYWTSFSDRSITIDAFDVNVETNLQKQKFAVMAYITPPWQNTDTFVPDLPEYMFPLYLADVKAACFRYLKQMTSVRDERKVAHDTAVYRNKATADGPAKTQVFGRR